METHQVHVRVNSDSPKCGCQLLVRGAVFILMATIVFLNFVSGVAGRQLKPDIEIGGNVSALIQVWDTAGAVASCGKVKVSATDRTSASNITLFSTFCNNLLLESVWLPIRNFSLKTSKGSLLPFNYYGGDTPVYSAGGKGSFISISISAEATNYNGPILSCGVRIFLFADFLLYNNFVNNTCDNVTISKLSQQDFKCLPVGLSGLPLSSLTTFELVEHGYHRLVILTELSVSINSTVTGQLFHYNTSFLSPVFCDLDTACTLYPHSYRQLANVTDSVCNLALADEYTTIVIMCTTVLLYSSILILTTTMTVMVMVTVIVTVMVMTIFRVKSKCMHIKCCIPSLSSLLLQGSRKLK